MTTTVLEKTGPNAEGKARQKVEMRKMQRRMVQHLADGRTTDMAPGVRHVDIRIFTDPERLALEKRELFQKLPMLAGLSSDMPNPGDVILFEAAGPSIVVTRNKAGKVHAFLNNCRHRAAKIVKECGHASRLSCPFHGWTYDLEGKLIGIPGQEAFEGIDKAQYNLIKVPVAEWHGMIFVKAHAGDEEIDVEAFLGPLAPELKQLDLANTVPIKKGRIDVKANWKFAQDTFFEGYHFATLHPTTIAASAFSNIIVHDEFGPHQRVMMPQHSYLDWVGKPESEWGAPPYQGIHLIFPNTIFFSGHVDGFNLGGQSDRQIFGIWRGYPGETPGESYTLMATYRPTDHGTDADNAHYAEVTDFILTVIETEDYSLCADGQKNLENSPEGYQVMFGRNEVALQSIHRNLEKALGLETP